MKQALAGVFTASLLAASAHAAPAISVLSRIEMQQDGSDLIVVLSGSRSPDVTFYTLSDPERVVVDWAGSHVEGVEREQSFSDGLVKRIVTQQLNAENERISRVTFELTKECMYRVESKETRVLVRFIQAKAPQAERAVAKKAPEPSSTPVKATVIEGPLTEPASIPAPRPPVKVEIAALHPEKPRARPMKISADDEPRPSEPTKKLKKVSIYGSRDDPDPVAMPKDLSPAKAESARSMVTPELSDPPRRHEAESKRATARAKREEARALDAARREEARQAEASRLEEKRNREAERRKEEAARIEEIRAAELARREDARVAREAAKLEEARLLAEKRDEERNLERERVEASNMRAPEANPLAVSMNGRSPRRAMSFLGFRSRAESSEVLIRCDGIADAEIKNEGASRVVLELKNTSLAIDAHRRALDTQYFPGAVTGVHAESRGNVTRVIVELRTTAAYRVERDGSTIKIAFENAR